jgi:hypothetical protein
MTSIDHPSTCPHGLTCLCGACADVALRASLAEAPAAAECREGVAQERSQCPGRPFGEVGPCVAVMRVARDECFYCRRQM